MVVEEAGEVRTVILCADGAAGQAALKIVAMKAHRGRIWNMMGNQQFVRGMWEHFTLKRAEEKKILEDAAREKQQGTQGQWQQKSLFREILEQVRGNVDMGCGPQMMRKGYLAMRDGSWEEFKKRYGEVEKLSEWTLERTHEAHEKVARDEIGRLCIVQDILPKSTDFLRRVIAPVGWIGGVTLSYICPHCNSFPLENYIWCVSMGKKHYSSWCAVCGRRYEWKAPNRYWWWSSLPTPMGQKFSERTRRHKDYVTT